VPRVDRRGKHVVQLHLGAGGRSEKHVVQLRLGAGGDVNGPEHAAHGAGAVLRHRQVFVRGGIQGGAWLRVQGLGFRVQGSGSRDQGLGFTDERVDRVFEKLLLHVLLLEKVGCQSPCRPDGRELFPEIAKEPLRRGADEVLSDRNSRAGYAKEKLDARRRTRSAWRGRRSHDARLQRQIVAGARPNKSSDTR